MASAVRAGSGAFVGRVGARPEHRLVLYEMEACPYSRKVREQLCTLDLDVDIRPCPDGGSRHRRELRAIGGREEIPLLVDPNQDLALYGSDAIVRYLARTYGDGTVPWPLELGPLTDMTSKLASLLRMRAGSEAELSRRPTLPLEMWGFEPCPDCRLVREVLCAYQIGYVLHNAARGSAKRLELRERMGAVKLPALFDSNTGASVTGRQPIVDYLRSMYGARRIPDGQPVFVAEIARAHSMAA